MCNKPCLNDWLLTFWCQRFQVFQQINGIFLFSTIFDNKMSIFELNHKAIPICMQFIHVHFCLCIGREVLCILILINQMLRYRYIHTGTNIGMVRVNSMGNRKCHVSLCECGCHNISFHRILTIITVLFKTCIFYRFQILVVFLDCGTIDIHNITTA